MVMAVPPNKLNNYIALIKNRIAGAEQELARIKTELDQLKTDLASHRKPINELDNEKNRLFAEYGKYIALRNNLRVLLDEATAGV
jgi:chromosome segregation ATPase